GPLGRAPNAWPRSWFGGPGGPPRALPAGRLARARPPCRGERRAAAAALLPRSRAQHLECEKARERVAAPPSHPPDRPRIPAGSDGRGVDALDGSPGLSSRRAEHRAEPPRIPPEAGAHAPVY